MILAKTGYCEECNDEAICHAFTVLRRESPPFVLKNFGKGDTDCHVPAHAGPLAKSSFKVTVIIANFCPDERWQ